MSGVARRVPEVSVIVPVRDGAASLPGLLASLRRQTLAPERFEVVVVDNASRDGSGEVARRAGATVVEEPRPGRARTRNRGAGAARGELLAFCDADCVADPGWLEALTACLRAAPLAAGEVRLTTGAPPNRIERLESLWRFQQERWVREGGWAASANLAARREAFEAIGGFDPAYRHIGEDVDLCLRARRAGFELGWCPDAVVEHPAEARLGPVLRRAFLHGFSSTQLRRRLAGGAGRRYWPHPGALIRGDSAIGHTGADPATLAPAERRALLAIAKLEYAARMAGSAWAELRGAG